MDGWWHALDGSGRLFWGIAIAATIVQILMFAASLLGSGDLDHSTDGSSAADATQGVKLISVRAIVAFLVGFGWTGGLLLQKGTALFPALAAALVAGLVFMLVIFVIMRAMMTLRDDGTLDFQNAVGHTGSVYVTVPPLRSGHGQVEIEIQGRITTVQAVTADERSLPPQTAITVDSVEPGNLLVVSRRF